MTAVFGQDLCSSATQLGKALEDPIDGLTALRRVGISFSDTPERADPHAGRDRPDRGSAAGHPRCPRTAGRRRRCGRSGRAHRCDQPAAGRLGQPARGDRPHAGGHLASRRARSTCCRARSRGSRPRSKTIRSAERIAAATAQLAQARDELARLEAGGPGTPMLGQRFAIDEQRQRVAALEQELATLTRIGEAEAASRGGQNARAPRRDSRRPRPSGAPTRSPPSAASWTRRSISWRPVPPSGSPRSTASWPRRRSAWRRCARPTAAMPADVDAAIRRGGGDRPAQDRGDQPAAGGGGQARPRSRRTAIGGRAGGGRARLPGQREGDRRSRQAAGAVRRRAPAVRRPGAVAAVGERHRRAVGAGRAAGERALRREARPRAAGREPARRAAAAPAGRTADRADAHAGGRTGGDACSSWMR